MSQNKIYIDSNGVLTIYFKFINFEIQRNNTEFCFRILARLFLDRRVLLITRDPQSYSLGHELPFKLMNVDCKHLLVNENIQLNLELLKEINESEEFLRALLVISDDKNAVNNVIRLVYDLDEPSIVRNLELKGPVAHFDPDGNYLYLINTNLSVDDLELMSKT